MSQSFRGFVTSSCCCPVATRGCDSGQCAINKEFDDSIHRTGEHTAARGRIRTSAISGRKFDISIRPIGRRVATKGVSRAFGAHLGKFRLPRILIIKPIHNVYLPPFLYSLA